jgi:hypothetical protein
MQKDNTCGSYRKNRNQSPVIGWEITEKKTFQRRRRKRDKMKVVLRETGCKGVK